MLNAVTYKIEKIIHSFVIDKNVNESDKLKKLNEEFYTKYYKPIVNKCSVKYN